MAASGRALVLFAHGARDARWREPFERLQQKLVAALPGCEVRLSFLELMSPLLPDTLAELAAGGVAEVTVVPVFFGQGGHIRRDLPALLDQCRQAHPGLQLHCAAAVGESDAVLDAIAAYCMASLPGADRAQP
ncbi:MULTISPECIES: sirohydrochlorin chelatase [Cupriavidus]|uniref:Cobalamin biosynthesis protein CbiX n=1 Tax=Cupriavidus oxalaticus TaxID=96344 RepID=A0A4P7LKR5_9BURK|nr:MULTISPECIES: CbiX/SirB N-terminal domain-containing protein [Cupriavidus]MBF6992040.1 CbiX/SirB N-terminal domain-containing protein [Cupriavidus sp. IK-TO18]QBY54103.1 cobalamin biosynthesis protein CbiX [Cupriavidus oxalaticus]TDF67794.1 cobalamin biosynthesis protein CbiX [Cupriavidus sp. L7L]